MNPFQHNSPKAPAPDPFSGLEQQGAASSEVQDDSSAAGNFAMDLDITPEGPDIAVRSDGAKTIDGVYRKTELLLPPEVNAASGIAINGRLIKSLVFSTDLAIILNCDADAVLAVYPFTCQPVITQALINAAERPVFPGVAGSLTTGSRSVLLAMESEMQGAMGVVVNATTRPITIRSMARSIDIPVVLTVTGIRPGTFAQINSGARIVNVAAGRETPDVVRQLRARYPEMPIIASGGKSPQSIKATIEAGADAITWTPPTIQELEKVAMMRNRRSDGAFAPLPFGGFNPR